jgi:hypothetical protein
MRAVFHTDLSVNEQTNEQVSMDAGGESADIMVRVAME